MNINYGGFKMSSPNYHEVLVLARELKENERVKLILDISKTMTNVLMNKKTMELCCPYCGSSSIVKNGKNKATQRYLCKTCSKSFISVTNTPIYYSRKEINIWSEYTDLLFQGYSLRETIKIIPISLKTAFLWRHKILDALRENLKTKELCGQIQADETYFRESVTRTLSFFITLSSTLKRSLLPGRPMQLGSITIFLLLSKAVSTQTCIFDIPLNLAGVPLL